MVFGLATKKEINEINKLKDLREYCTGKYQLSALQYNITRSQRINGEVKTKSILTPYAFTCDKNYSIYANFEINNGNSYSDYRCEYMLIATIIFSVLVCCVTVFLLIYFICKCRSNTTKRYTFLILFIFIGITTINFMAVKCFSAIKNSESEYLNEKTTFLFKLSDITLSSSVSINVVEPMIVMFIIMSFTVYTSIFILRLNKCLSCLIKSITFILIAAYYLLTIYNLIFKTKGVFIALCAVFCISILFFLALKPIMFFFKLGSIFFFIMIIITSIFGKYIIDKTQEKLPTLYVIILFEIISMILQSISITLILVGVLYFEDFKIPDDYMPIFNDNFIYTVQNTTNQTNNNNIKDNYTNNNINDNYIGSKTNDDEINQQLNQQNDKKFNNPYINIY